VGSCVSIVLQVFLKIHFLLSVTHLIHSHIQYILLPLKNLSATFWHTDMTILADADADNL